MEATKSLISSKTFWGALMQLLAIVATAFHLTGFAAWAADPAHVDAIAQIGGLTVGVLGTALTIWGRMSATKQITSILPAAPAAKINSPWFAGLMACVLAVGLGGCFTLTTGQQAIIETIGTVAVSDLCALGQNQFSKVGSPSAAQQLAKAHMDAVCADPQVAAAVLVNTYNQLATVIGSKPATALAPAGATVAVGG